jgi:dTDP-4-amino-4,6-dideoxygalactose transaminase
MAVTDERSARLIRLPLWLGMDAPALDTVVRTLEGVLAIR